MSDCFDHGEEAMDRWLDGEDQEPQFPAGREDDGVVCKFCGEGGLEWEQTDNGWRLFDEGEMLHDCLNVPSNLPAPVELAPVVVDFKPLTEKENLLMLNRKYAVVSFDQDNRGGNHSTSKTYTYLTDLELVEGDKVVVDTPGNGLSVVTVVGVRGLTAGQRTAATKWIVAKVDLDHHKERLRKQEAAQEIRNKLHEKKQQFEELQIYRELAKSDPEIKKLLVELSDVDETVTLLEDK